VFAEGVLSETLPPANGRLMFRSVRVRVNLTLTGRRLPLAVAKLRTMCLIEIFYGRKTNQMIGEGAECV
jgi:hypothetical protein